MAGLSASRNLETLRLSNAQWEAASFFDTRLTLSSSWGTLVVERDTAGNEIETHTSHTTFPDFDVMTSRRLLNFSCEKGRAHRFKRTNIS